MTKMSKSSYNHKLRVSFNVAHYFSLSLYIFWYLFILEKSNKMEHMKTHSGDKIYPCTSCGKLFSGKTTLDEHMKIHQVTVMTSFDKHSNTVLNFPYIQKEGRRSDKSHDERTECRYNSLPVQMYILICIQWATAFFIKLLLIWTPNHAHFYHKARRIKMYFLTVISPYNERRSKYKAHSKLFLGKN